MDIMRKQFTIGLAGLLIEIDTVSPRTCVYCMDYLQEGKPDIRIKVTEKDVENELLECESEGIRKNRIGLETMCAYRKITESVIDYGIVLMHGAVIAVGNCAYMFSAPSGTGKTTHIRLWLRNANCAYVVNGDKPLIKVEEDMLIACGTPWSGDERMNTNTMKPLKSIIFMERSENNRIEKLSFQQAYPYLIQQTYIPHNKEMAIKVLSLLSSMNNKTSFWHFYFNNLEENCFETSYNTLINQE